MEQSKFEFVLINDESEFNSQMAEDDCYLGDYSSCGQGIDDDCTLDFGSGCTGPEDTCSVVDFS